MSDVGYVGCSTLLNNILPTYNRPVCSDAAALDAFVSKYCEYISRLFNRCYNKWLRVYPNSVRTSTQEDFMIFQRHYPRSRSRFVRCCCFLVLRFTSAFLGKPSGPIRPVMGRSAGQLLTFFIAHMVRRDDVLGRRRHFGSNPNLAAFHSGASRPKTLPRTRPAGHAHHPQSAHPSEVAALGLAAAACLIWRCPHLSRCCFFFFCSFSNSPTCSVLLPRRLGPC